jgi:glycine/D-amino acid oxidase-like deaminating enzyme
MAEDPFAFDAVVIGGGFYGTAIAVYLARQRGLRRILLAEQEGALFMRASHNNQARVHNGYHYPRSFATAYRSRVNLPKFVGNWAEAIKKDFTSIYAIASRNSAVTAGQFQRFCRDIDARLEPAGAALRALFEPRLIEEVFVVEEYAFDANLLALRARRDLAECGVELRLDTRVTAISNGSDGRLAVTLQRRGEASQAVSCRYLFNCAYTGLNHFAGDFACTKTLLKHELTEMALVDTPPALRGLAVTVMDGPFFSLMPFPERGLHTLSHVRYTPHLSWSDQPEADPYSRLALYDGATRFDRMLRDVRRYLPIACDMKYVESIFEIKTVLAKNEGDDGRPILFEKHPELPGCHSILGGKIDNIFDIFERLDGECIGADVVA